MGQAHYDVCVIGGGPAGCVAATRLAQFHRRVCLVERSAFPRHHIGESLTAGIWPILDSVGLRERVLRQGFPPVGETLVRWAEPVTELVLPQQRGASLLVDRGKFDLLILRAAADAGVHVFQPGMVRTAVGQDCGWRLEVVFEGQSHALQADFLVDASGRNGFLAGRRNRMSARTVALSGSFPAPDCATATLVEAFADGWIWGAGVPGGSFNAMVFLDNRDLLHIRRGGLEQFWRLQLAKSELFRDLAQAPLDGPLTAHDATAYAAEDPVGPRYIRVGEASFSLDPLSSTGVEKAMQTGLVAAIALSTMASSPGRSDLCARFCRDRQKEVVASHARWSSSFYATVKRYSDLPFWQDRCDGFVQHAERPAEPRLQHLVGQRTKVRISREARLVEEPCIIDDQILGQMALLHPSLDRPLVFLDGVGVAGLLEVVSGDPEIGSLRALWSNRISPSQARHIGDWLLNNRILETVSPDVSEQ